MLSVRTETPEGGVVVRDRAHVSGKLVKRPAVATGGKRPFGILPVQKVLSSSVSKVPHEADTPHASPDTRTPSPQPFDQRPHRLGGRREALRRVTICILISPT